LRVRHAEAARRHAANEDYVRKLEAWCAQYEPPDGSAPSGNLPAEYYTAMQTLAEAREIQRVTGVEVLQLMSHLDLADNGHKWLADAKINSVIPWSIDEKDWVEACGGHGMLAAPAWLDVQRSSIEEEIHSEESNIKLFKGVQPDDLSVRVKILAANELQKKEWLPHLDTYCVCDIPGKSHSRFETPIVYYDQNPVWNHEQEVYDYAIGDPLFFTVFHKSDRSRKDITLGVYRLSPGEFFPRGAELQVPLDQAGTPDAKLQVKIDVLRRKANPRARLDVMVQSASGLRENSFGGKANAYCICMIPGKPQTRFRTKTIMNNQRPEWNERGDILDFDVGDQLEFSVYDKEQGSRQPKRDDILGRGILSTDKIFPDGFEGQLKLEEAGGADAYLRVKVRVYETRRAGASPPVDKGDPERYSDRIKTGDSARYTDNRDTWYGERDSRHSDWQDDLRGRDRRGYESRDRDPYRSQNHPDPSPREWDRVHGSGDVTGFRDAYGSGRSQTRDRYAYGSQQSYGSDRER